jgi:atypical dual specificity phosphatase
MDLKGEIEQFSKASLRRTSTKITHADGSSWLETVPAHQDNNYSISRLTQQRSPGFVVDDVPDLQIGWILPNLLLASVDVTRDLSLLTQHRITHILNVAEHEHNPPEYCGDSTGSTFESKHISILDLPEVKITEYFDECFAFINSALQAGGRILVHCMAGVSRSAAIVIGYLMKNNSMNFETAYCHVKSKRPSVQPNSGFLKQLRNYEHQLCSHGIITSGTCNHS